jgi:hypothetical protein
MMMTKGGRACSSYSGDAREVTHPRKSTSESDRRNKSLEIPVSNSGGRAQVLGLSRAFIYSTAQFAARYRVLRSAPHNASASISKNSSPKLGYFVQETNFQYIIRYRMRH